MNQQYSLYAIGAILTCLLLSALPSQLVAAEPFSNDISFSPSHKNSQAYDLVRALFLQGLEAYKERQLQVAITHWENALALTEDPQQRAQTLGNLAISYYETGQYPSALETNQQALDLFTALDNPGAVGQVYSNLGNVYEALGQYGSAISAYEESTILAQANNRRQSEGISTGNLGYVYSLQGDQTAALNKLQIALEIARETGDREGESHRLLNMGIAYHALREYENAIASYQLSIEVAQEIGNAGLEANTLINLALAVADSGQLEDAIAYLEQSLAIAQSLEDPALTAMTLNNLGHTLITANRLDDAEARLKEAINNLDNLRNNLEDTYNVSLFDTQVYTYNLLTQILVEKQDFEAALEISEAGRTRAFTALLSNRKASTIPSSSAATSASTSTENTPPSIDKIRQIAQQTNSTLVEYSLVPEDAFRIQGRQKGRTSEIHIWIVKPDGQIHFHRQPIDAQSDSLESVIGNYRSATGARSRGFAPATPSSDESAATDSLKTLHQMLIEPIQDWLPDNPEDNVIFIPQGKLFQVPFPALIDSEGDYFIEHHTLLTAPSIQILEFAQQRQAYLSATDQASSQENSQRPLIIGNPDMPQVWNPDSGKPSSLTALPGAEQEALKIAEFFGTEALIGEAATENIVKEKIGEASIVHFATHGLLDYGDPQSTGVSDSPGALALTATGDQDGLLTSTEIQNDLTLTADLVVLSACDTGSGEVTGDGVIGLARSFIIAGTPSIIVSLWAVPDAPTATLMTEFYQQLQQGESKAQALRQAMLITMKDHPDPSDWAAFTLIGEAD